MPKTNGLSHQHEDPRWDLILRITASSQLKGSPRLCELLLYVADCALRESPEEVTEQQIGIQVFGRHAGFNSSEDSIVRTQARLLRIKMGAYFAGEGAFEAITVEIPKGHYLPVFRTAALRTSLKVVEPAAPQHMPLETPPVPLSGALSGEAESEAASALEPDRDSGQGAGSARAVRAHRGNWTAWPTAALLALILLLGGAFLARTRLAVAASPVLTLWRPFLTQEPPLVIYSNALFEGDSKTGLRYAPLDTPHDQPMPEHLVDHYTGVGELVSVYELTRLFDSRQAKFTLKRSLLVTWDEAKLRNLIFIGAAVENGSIRVLPTASDFTMVSANGSASIVNQHPRMGEPAMLTRPEYPLTRDYAIIALLPGVEPGHHTIVLSGLTTMGTEAAVEFACRKESVAELLKVIGYTSGEVRPFEVVLEVTIGGGVPLQSKIVLFRAH